MTEMQNRIALWTGDYIMGETDLHELEGQAFVANDCTLLLCTEGCAVVTANGRKQTFRKGNLAMLFSDVLFTPLCLSSSFKSIYLCLSERLMEDVYYKMTSAIFWEQASSSPVLRLSNEQYLLICGWFAQMQWIIEQGKEENIFPLLRGSIFNLFLAIDGELQKYTSTTTAPFRKDRAWTLFGKFVSLLSKHCHETREVQFYADKLCITTDYLYKVCGKIQGQTPKEIINTQTANDLKRYLTGTDLSVKDLAREFHFEDPSYLSRFFRRITGVSPQDYRNGQGVINI